MGTPAGTARTLLASNRGPVAFSRAPDGSLVPGHGGGGLVTALHGGATAPDSVWLCSAMDPAEREAAAAAPGGRLDLAGHDTGGAALRMLDIAPQVFHRAYNGIANSLLWFLQHQLHDAATEPHFDLEFAQQWEGYRAYNDTFAEALATDAAPGAAVLVQDYHLLLTPALLRERRPDLRTSHFTHTPWAGPEQLSVLPAEVARELLAGMLGADHLGFLSPRWAEAFLACASSLLGAEVEGSPRDGGRARVSHDGRTVTVGVHALGVDAEWLRARAARADVEERRAALLARTAGRRLVVRIDRTELSKNIVRGLSAYRELLRTEPRWRGEVVHVAFAYPSRSDLPRYRAYTAQMHALAAEIDAEFATPDWQPLLLDVRDDFARSLAGYRLADVLVVNPVRDGMNLVAKEGPLLSETGCALVLSEHAGAADELAGAALLVNPFDVSATARAMHEALLMDPVERRRRCDVLADAAARLPPRQWLAAQLDALER